MLAVVLALRCPSYCSVDRKEEMARNDRAERTKIETPDKEPKIQVAGWVETDFAITKYEVSGESTWERTRS